MNYQKENFWYSTGMKNQKILPPGTFTGTFINTIIRDDKEGIPFGGPPDGGSSFLLWQIIPAGGSMLLILCEGFLWAPLFILGACIFSF